MTLKKAIRIILIILLLWICIFSFDLITVACFGKAPVFCIEWEKGKGHYTGVGYSYDAYPHPVSGKPEYALYIFGIEVNSTFTNELTPVIKS